MIPRRAWLAAATLLPGTLHAQAAPVRLPPVTLVDQAGRRWPLGELVRRRPVLVSFFFTGCTTVCPPQTAALADLQAEIARRTGPAPGSGPLLLSISLDPMGDTPANLRAYAARFGIATGAEYDWLMLGGEPQALARVWAAFEVPGGGPESHLAFVWISQPGGRSWHRTSAFARPEELAALLLDAPGMKAALAVAMAIALLPLCAAAEAPDGRALFHGFQSFAAGRAATDRRLPAAYVACANCHGALAEGGREGGSIVPPIGQAALFRPQGEQPAYPSVAAVIQAILAGTGRDGRSLAAIMPRYRLEPAELAALLDYLGRVGTAADLPPGVTATSIALGTVLPLTGEAAPSGQAILAGLQEVFAAVAAQGGVHGRQVQLTVADGAALGPEAAIRQLLTQPVHAVVGGLWPAGTSADAALATTRVPHIGSLVVRADARDAGPWTADLLPPVTEQQAMLARSLGACETAGPRFALHFGKAVPEPAVGITWLADTTALAAALRDAGSAGCLGLDLVGLTRMGTSLPAGWRVLLVLPFPAALLGDGPRPDPWRHLGRAAARLAVEWLARAGTRLHEGSLPAQSNGSQGYEPLPGAAVRFSRHRRHAWDAEVITLTTERGG